MALPTFTALPTVVYTAVPRPGAPATADLARLAFGAVLWVVLIVVNRGASNGSTKRSATEAEHDGVGPGGETNHKNWEG